MRSSKARDVARTGLLFALAVVLSWLESCITPLLGLIPALKLGLSNIVVMYALLFFAPPHGLLSGATQGTVCLFNPRCYLRHPFYLWRPAFAGDPVGVVTAPVSCERIHFLCMWRPGPQSWPAVGCLCSSQQCHGPRIYPGSVGCGHCSRSAEFHPGPGPFFRSAGVHHRVGNPSQSVHK